MPDQQRREHTPAKVSTANADNLDANIAILGNSGATIGRDLELCTILELQQDTRARGNAVNRAAWNWYCGRAARDVAGERVPIPSSHRAILTLLARLRETDGRASSDFWRWG